MYAVEFRARVKDGAIEIPPQYRSKLSKFVRVIVLAEPEEKKKNFIDQLLERPFQVAGFQPLSRDEIHARA